MSGETVESRHDRLAVAVLAHLEEEGGALAQAIEKFCVANCGNFEGESKSEMYKVDYTVLHEEFQALVEDSLSTFIKAQGLSVLEFVDVMRQQPLHPLLRSIEATTDFDVFVSMMRECKEHGW